MPHLHESFLKQFKIEIDKMVPMTPKEFIDEANKIYEELSNNPEATEKQIHQAMALVGKKEFPYRKAYDELCESDEEQRLQKLVFERLDLKVKQKVQEVTKHGVVLEEYMKSDLFEENLSGEERYQLEQAILLVEDQLEHQCDERANKRKVQYEDLVKKWQEEADRLQKMIDNLRAMASPHPKWAPEVNSICDRLEEGWSITERDPEEQEIRKELDYWVTVFGEVEDESGLGDRL